MSELRRKHREAVTSIEDLDRVARRTPMLPSIILRMIDDAGRKAERGYFGIGQVEHLVTRSREKAVTCRFNLEDICDPISDKSDSDED